MTFTISKIVRTEYIKDKLLKCNKKKNSGTEKGQNPMQDLTDIQMLQTFTTILVEHLNIIYSAWPH